MASTVPVILVTMEKSVKTVRTEREDLVFCNNICINQYHVYKFSFLLNGSMYLDPCDIRSRKNETCENDGNCIIKKTSNSANASCECANGFHGEHCEIRNHKI